MKDFNWFKKEIIPYLNGYELTYRSYEEGDFGSLDQVIFESNEKGGVIDFWGLGWLGIDVYDYKNNEQILTILLEPHQEEAKTEAFNRLKVLLNS